MQPAGKTEEFESRRGELCDGRDGGEGELMRQRMASVEGDYGGSNVCMAMAYGAKRRGSRML